MGTDNIDTSNAAEGSSTSRRRFLGATGVGAAGIWAAPQLMSAASAQAVASDQPPPPPCTVYGQNLVTNGGFETGDLSGWTMLTRGADNATPEAQVGWFAYASGDNSPLSNLAIAAPSEGGFGAVADQQKLGSSVLYQDFTIPADACSARLRANGTYDNTDPVCEFQESEDLEVTNVFGNNDSQRVRVDIMDPASVNPFSTQVADTIMVLFTTDPGDPDTGTWSVDVDLSSFVGQTLRIRFGFVISCNLLLATVDDVRVDV